MKKIAVFFVCCLLCAALARAQTHNETVWAIDFADEYPGGDIVITKNFCWIIDKHLVFSSPDSLLKISFSLSAARPGKYELRITDRASTYGMTMTSIARGGICYSDIENYPLAIAVLVNDRESAYNAPIKWTNDQTSAYRVDKFLRDGKNIITILLNPNSTIRYEIRKIELIRIGCQA